MTSFKLLKTIHRFERNLVRSHYNIAKNCLNIFSEAPSMYTGLIISQFFQGSCSVKFNPSILYNYPVQTGLRKTLVTSITNRLTDFNVLVYV